ncbi:hypothetical protein ACHHYP_15700 [Achlya hypogyna]|uniref:M96 mating-specific protein family n=1 Tax=Achlya hypogyna TaxID=1202772 RepID=A0A1V9YA86_ACHHY|nr:hypothetical protein ACHHYP_15700 [Achlya hypogyna]
MLAPTATSGAAFTAEERDILQTICSSKKASAPPSAYHRQVAKHQQELAYLKSTIEDLNTRLREVQAAKEAADAERQPTHWHALAKHERKRHLEAVAENRRLKSALEEQIEFAEALKRLMNKKPRLCLYPTDPADMWKDLKLATAPDLRYAAFHAIADREFENLASAFVEAGLVDAVNVPPQHFPHLRRNTLEVRSRLAVRIPPQLDPSTDFQLLSDATWDIIRGAVVAEKDRSARELLAEVDDSVSYTSATRKHNMGKSHRRVVYKRYVEPRRLVIVGRSVEEDELFPLNPAHDVSHEVMWCVVEAQDDGHILVRYCHNVQPFHGRRDFEPMLISRFVMDIKSGFSLGLDAVAAEVIRRYAALGIQVTEDTVADPVLEEVPV